VDIDFSQLLQQLINGLSYGAIYALIAVGYTMVYGVLRLINFAHGDIYMVGAMIGLYTFTFCGIAAEPAISQCPTALWVITLVALVAALINLALHFVLAAWHNRSRRGAWMRLALAGAAVALCPFFRWSSAPLNRPASWMSLVAIVIVAMLLCALMGAFIERFAYRPLRSSPRIDSLITAIGVSMLLEFGGQSKYVFGASPQAFPAMMPGLEDHPALFHIGGVVVGRVDALIFVVSLVLMVLLWFIVMRTRTGMALRAVSHRFDTAALMGIDVDRIVAFTFMLGSSLAAVAGILVALRTSKVDPLMGIQPGLKAFVAAVLGGIGNIPGAVAGGLLLGITEVMVAGYLHEGSQYKEGVAFVILIAVLLVKPTGLFGKNTIEKV
jgi:branched-chain amino acid transport system permease protein